MSYSLHMGRGGGGGLRGAPSDLQSLQNLTSPSEIAQRERPQYYFSQKQKHLLVMIINPHQVMMQWAFTRQVAYFCEILVFCCSLWLKFFLVFNRLRKPPKFCIHILYFCLYFRWTPFSRHFSNRDTSAKKTDVLRLNMSGRFAVNVVVSTN